MTNEIALFKNFGLATPDSVTYSESMNAFLSAAYTSMAGNTYYNAARFAEGLFIKEDVGDGYAHTFLNGLHIYDIQTKKLICERYFNCHFYSKDAVRCDAKNMLGDILMEAARKTGHSVNEQDVRRKVGELIDRAFRTNQVEMLQQNIRALGF